MNISTSISRALIQGVTVSAVLCSSLAFAAGGPPRIGPGTMPLSPIEVADLKFMREEEKVARDLYLALDARYPVLQPPAA